MKRSLSPIASSRRGERHPTHQSNTTRKSRKADDQVCEKELQKHLHDIEREVEADPNGAEWEDLDAGNGNGKWKKGAWPNRRVSIM